LLDLRRLLEDEGLDPNKVLVLRHRPVEPRLRKIFCWLAQEEPEVFNAYQRSHGPKTETAVSNASQVVSFIGHEAGQALFIGIFDVQGSIPVTRADYDRHPEYIRLMELGMSPWDETDPRQTALIFDLQRTERLQQWTGKLVVDWPSPERSWYRWAGRNTFPVRAIHEDSRLVASMPAWHEISLGWEELAALPREWRGALAQWRGIYFVFDRSDGKGYVGSAYGSENMLGRWLNYSASGHGGNRLLQERDPIHFVFSILQRVSPDLPPEEVIALESSWKTRLHTRDPYGLNGN
jgi:hypothetical protein